jgi:hypothetical protein
MTSSRKTGKWYFSRDSRGNLVMSHNVWLLTPKEVRESPEGIEALVDGRIQVLADMWLDENDPRNLYCPKEYREDEKEVWEE